MLSILPDSVSADIAKAAGGEISFQNIGQGLVELRIIRDQSHLVNYRDLHSWHRGGGETYVSDFSIDFVDENDDVQTLHILGKAIICLTNVEHRWKQWEKRSNILIAHGVNVPNNFSYWRGVVFQQYIPFDFCSYFATRSAAERSLLADKLIDFAIKIDKAGFYVTGFMHNLRTDGNDIYIVDVGEDLGDPDASLDSRRTFDLANRWIQRAQATSQASGDTMQ
ncbi:MAG TPA: hypothetical protein VF658_21340 [Pyrinomonadaceae bacterium]|jgi:hypothetical protein